MAITILPVTPGMIDPAWRESEMVTRGHGLVLHYDPTGKVERWIGRSKCGAAVRVEGRRAELREREGNREVRACVVSVDEQTIHMCRMLNTHELVSVQCPGCKAWKACKLVYDGGKPDSKRHECGVKCRNATGPACDCKCRGANHGCG